MLSTPWMVAVDCLRPSWRRKRGSRRRVRRQLNEGRHLHPLNVKPGSPNVGGRGTDRLFERFGFPIKGNESDSVACHNGAIVATGFVERITLFSAENGRGQYHGKTIGVLPFHPSLLSPGVQPWEQLST